jgi:hypothetical protein
MKKIYFSICFCYLLAFQIQAQIESSLTTIKSGNGYESKFLETHSKFAPFPDSARGKGHDYNGQHFDFENHYNDSSVKVYIPERFHPNQSLELVIWFHGWNNNIDSANSFFRLSEQFEASGRNAILIFPEGPKNAPDSYGGKFERPEMFELFINDLIKQMELHKIIPKKQHFTIKDCSISLAGHSGAYRIISKIIQYNKIDEVILFDAMYGGNDAYLKWIAASDQHRFINIYTKDGGTFDNTHLIMNQLKDSLHQNYLSINETALKPALLQSTNRYFIFSEKEHNEVISNNLNWYQFLKFRK